MWPRLLNRIRNGLLDRSRLSRSGKVGFEDVNLSLFFIRQLGSSALGELLDGILALFHEGSDDLERFTVVERMAAFDFTIHQRGFEHP